MAGHICLGCLSRPVQSTARRQLRSVEQLSAFSTSSPRDRLPMAAKKSVSSTVKHGAPAYAQKQKGVGGQGARGPREKTGKPLESGERKAVRKRLVLSNANALEVQGLRDLSAGNMTDASNKGQMLGLSNELIDSLKAMEAFKHTQGWSLFRRPATLIRAESMEMAKLIQNLQKNSRTERMALYGERGSGKSVLSLQTMAMAIMKGWIVISVPEAKETVIAHTAYVKHKDPATGRTVYIQPDYTAKLLSSIASANKTALSKLQLQQKHNLRIPVQSNISLDRFASLGINDPDIAWPIFTALLSELTASNRPPLLFAIDDVSHVMTDSAYLDENVNPIHAHDLALVQKFMNLLSGAEKLPNGGLVLATDSASNRPHVPSFDFALARNMAAAAKEQKAAKTADGSKAEVETPEWNPYRASDDRVMDAMKGVRVMKLGGMDKSECRGIMEYYARSGLLRQQISESFVGEKWAIAGGGIIGEVERGSVVMRI